MQLISHILAAFLCRESFNYLIGHYVGLRSGACWQDTWVSMYTDHKNWEAFLCFSMYRISCAVYLSWIGSNIALLHNPEAIQSVRTCILQEAQTHTHVTYMLSNQNILVCNNQNTFFHTLSLQLHWIDESNEVTPCFVFWLRLGSSLIRWSKISHRCLPGCNLLTEMEYSYHSLFFFFFNFILN